MALVAWLWLAHCVVPYTGETLYELVSYLIAKLPRFGSLQRASQEGKVTGMLLDGLRVAQLVEVLPPSGEVETGHIDCEHNISAAPDYVQALVGRVTEAQEVLDEYNML